MSSPFDYIKSISETKEDMIVDAQSEKDYNAWIVNVGLSLYIDTVLYSNEMNMLPDLDNKLQYDYLLHSIKKRKRYTKWLKRKKDEDVLAIGKYFGYNINKSKMALSILTKEQLKEIRDLEKDI